MTYSQELVKKLRLNNKKLSNFLFSVHESSNNCKVITVLLCS